jgi:hypothetical protein
MSRRRPPVEDFNHTTLTWIFMGLMIVAALAGIAGEVAR